MFSYGFLRPSGSVTGAPPFSFFLSIKSSLRLSVISGGKRGQDSLLLRCSDSRGERTRGRPRGRSVDVSPNRWAVASTMPFESASLLSGCARAQRSILTLMRQTHFIPILVENSGGSVCVPAVECVVEGTGFICARWSWHGRSLSAAPEAVNES